MPWTWQHLPPPGPYAEGWVITTSGGRHALRQGRRHSVLGFLGVVDVSSYRSWLRRTFRPMLPPAVDAASVR